MRPVLPVEHLKALSRDPDKHFLSTSRYDDLPEAGADAGTVSRAKLPETA